MKSLVRSPLVWIVFTIAAAPGCSKGDTAPPVAAVTLTLSKNQVAVGSILDLTYRFQVAQGAKISGDYKVFVHMNRDDGTIIWSDDHSPAAPTSSWQPGQVIEYTRTRFIPSLSYLGHATIEVGLYKDEERLPLSVPDAAELQTTDKAYKVATLDLLPRSQNIQIYKLTGWNNLEFAEGDRTQEWQWTQKIAVLSLRNPKRDVMLFLEYDTRSDLFADKPQQVRVYSGDVLLKTFAAASREVQLERIPIQAAQLGSAEMVELRLEIDRTFVPARLPNVGSDQRELGIRVFHAHVEPR